MAKRKNKLYMSIYFHLAQLAGSRMLLETQILHDLNNNISPEVCFLRGSAPLVISLRKRDLEN